MIAMMMVAVAAAQDYQVCEWQDPTYTAADWAEHGMIALWEPTMTPYDFVIGAGGGAVDWNGSTLTLGALNGIFNQGPAGYTLESAGHIKDGNGAPLDHLVWIAVTKDNQNGRKYFYVLSDRSLTGDADERMWGDFSQVWAVRYAQNPGAGITWPSNADILKSIEDHATAHIAKWEAALTTGSGELTAIAKANCANVYGGSTCNAMTWKHAAPHFEVFAASGGMTPSDWANDHQGTYHLHHPENTDTTYGMVSAWILIAGCTCNYTCETTENCAYSCEWAHHDMDCEGDNSCICTWTGSPPNCSLQSCRYAEVTKVVPSDW